jgi:hypothetical protein
VSREVVAIQKSIKFNSNETLLHMNDDLINQIKNLLKEIPPKDIKGKLLDLLIKAEAGDIKGILDNAVNDYESNYFNLQPKGKRQSLEKKVDELNFAWLASGHKIYMEPDGPHKRYSSIESIEKRLGELRLKMLDSPQDALVDGYARTIIALELALQDREALHAENTYLANFLKEHLHKRTKSVANQKTGKAKVYSNNNQCMKECLIEVTEDLSTDQITKRTYRKFCNLVTRRHTNPPFVQKLRQSKEDKQQSQESMDMDLEALKRNEWAPSTLRAFFENTTKLKIADLPK